MPRPSREDVVTVEDGQEALERVETSEPFDLVLTDVMMPRLGGFGLLRALRENPRTRATPILMLSARAGEEASVEGLEAGADDYLIKPFSARELMARTRSALELARMRREVAAHQAHEAGLEESLRARDEFLSIVSHELKTPLTPLALHLHAIQRSAHEGGGPKLSPQRVLAKLDVIVRQVDRLESIIDRLLDVVQVGQQPPELDCRDVDLMQVVRDTATGFTEDLERSGCSLELDLHGPVIGCWDERRLHEIASNLISNAIKFGAGRPIRISLELDEERARLSVRDEGVGIAPEDQARIFNRFERAAPARHYGGFGLGLWVGKQLVEAMGGAIHVESTVGNGSMFTVLLPLRREQC